MTQPSIFGNYEAVESAGAATNLSLAGYATPAAPNRKLFAAFGSFANPNASTMTMTYDGNNLSQVGFVNRGNLENFAIFEVPESIIVPSADFAATTTVSGQLGLVVFAVRDAAQPTPNFDSANATSMTGVVASASSLLVGIAHASYSDLSINWTGLTEFGFEWAYDSSNTSTFSFAAEQLNAGNYPISHDGSVGRPVIAYIDIPPA